MKRIFFILVIFMLIITACGLTERCPAGMRWQWVADCVAATKFQDLVPYYNYGYGRACGACAFGYKIASCKVTCE